MLIRQFSIKKNETIEIPFKELGSAGFLWNFNENQRVTENIITLSLCKDNVDPTMIGAPLTGKLIITGKETGFVSFEMKRPWDNEVAEKIEITVS